MSRPLKIGLIISFVLWRSSPDLQFERISSRLSVVIMKASLACLDAVIDADVPVPQRFPDAFDLSLDALLDGAEDYPGGGAGESAFGTLLLNIYAEIIDGITGLGGGGHIHIIRQYGNNSGERLYQHLELQLDGYRIDAVPSVRSISHLEGRGANRGLCGGIFDFQVCDYIRT